MKISIIIPVYNSEKYLDRCIQSILNQSFTDYELILVNDGSTDNSLCIMERFASLDSKIKVYNKKNGGVSSARNRGLEEASGTFIAFMDSDDYVNPDYLEMLASKCDDSIDYVFSGMLDVKGSSIIKTINLADKVWNLNQEEQFIGFLYQPLQSSPCSKLYSNNIIKKKHLSFDTSLSCAEDRDFNLKFFDHIQKAVSTSYSGYFYRRDVSNSLTKRINPNAFKNRCIHWKRKQEMCKKRVFVAESTNIRLANDLFHIANNEVTRVSKMKISIKEAFILCNEKRHDIDFSFLEKWGRHIKAPWWQKKLLLNHHLLLLIVFNKLYKHGKKKG